MKQLYLFKRAEIFRGNKSIPILIWMFIFIIASLNIQAQIDLAGEMELTKKTINQAENPGTADQFVDADFKLYPNPATSVIHIESKAKFKEGVVLTICDIRGTLMEKRKLGAIITKDDYSFNLGKYTSGQYIIGIYSIDGSFVCKKLIKR